MVLESDNLVYFDCDDTLVLWKTDEDPNDPIIEVKDPYIEGTTVKLVPHIRNINLLKRNHGQGRAVVVWSAGGVQWAKNIVYSLGLKNYVSLIICKPSIYVDDLDIKDWGLNRVYLHKNFRKHPISE